MDYMFSYCQALTSLDLSQWNTANVSYMNDMFNSCTALTSLNLSEWKLTNGVGMNGMFSGCKALSTLDISNWSMEEVGNWGSMFNYCASGSKVCQVTARQATKEFLLSETETTDMEPAWFYWTISDESSVDDMPNKEW
jgi:surface protein